MVNTAPPRGEGPAGGPGTQRTLSLFGVHTSRPSSSLPSAECRSSDELFPGSSLGIRGRLWPFILKFKLIKLKLKILVLKSQEPRCKCRGLPVAVASYRFECSRQHRESGGRPAPDLGDFPDCNSHSLSPATASLLRSSSWLSCQSFYFYNFLTFFIVKNT